jgi:heptosyltransferase-2
MSSQNVVSPERIIVRAPNWVGDAVLSIPALRSLRGRFPRARITLLVRPGVAGLFRSAAFADEVWDRPSPGILRWIPTARQVRREAFDLGVLLTNSFESALTLFAGGVAERAGYATDNRTPLLTRAVALPEGKLHQRDYYLHLLEAFLGPGPEVGVGIGLEATGPEREAARALLAAEGIEPPPGLLVLSPGAAFGSAKRWMEERFAAVADRTHRELGLRTVIIGTAAEEPIAARIRSMMAAPATVLAGRTDLETLVGVLAEASLVVANDSGPMHISAALGVPTLGIFGSTDAEVTGPLGPRTRVVRQAVECSPCLLRECPIDHRCMDRLSVERVFEAGRSLACG